MLGGYKCDCGLILKKPGTCVCGGKAGTLMERYQAGLARSTRNRPASPPEFEVFPADVQGVIEEISMHLSEVGYKDSVKILKFIRKTTGVMP